MAERRRLERFDLELPAAIEFMNLEYEKRLINLMTTNICSGGAYFHTTQPLPKGAQVKIDLVLPLDKLRKLKKEHEEAYIKVTGTVLRTESEGMAICFGKNYQITGYTWQP